VGLGNPGPKYNQTRHNFGFLLIDEVARMHQLSEGDWSEKYHSLYQKSFFKLASTGELEVLLVKPQTFMNASGEAVLPWKQFFKIPHEKILVLVDDYDLPFGHVRFRPSGSDGGHNGLKDIAEKIGPQFPRLRLGIRQETMLNPMVSYVLEKFNAEEKKQLPLLLKQMSLAVDDFLALGIEKAMNRWNKKSLLS
jgi:PTH1 family peptidyl-tRNA hydrolase